MSRPPGSGRASTGQKIEQAIEKAFDPLATALKRATTPPKPTPAAPGKPGLEISPLAGDPAHRRGRDRHRPGRLLQA